LRGASLLSMQNVLASTDRGTHESAEAQVKALSGASVARMHTRAKAGSLPEMERKMRRRRVGAEADPGRLHPLRGAPLMRMQDISAGADCRTHESVGGHMETSSRAAFARLHARATVASPLGMGSEDGGNAEAQASRLHASRGAQPKPPRTAPGDADCRMHESLDTQVETSSAALCKRSNAVRRCAEYANPNAVEFADARTNENVTRRTPTSGGRCFVTESIRYVGFRVGEVIGEWRTHLPPQAQFKSPR